jgi:hypothetical protein
MHVYSAMGAHTRVGHSSDCQGATPLRDAHDLHYLRCREYRRQRLKRAAELMHRSVEELAATTLEAAFPLAPDVLPEIANELTARHLFSDEALWAATAPVPVPDRGNAPYAT